MKLADTVASHLAVKIPDRQAILETTTVPSGSEKVLGLIDSEISVLQVGEAHPRPRQAADGENPARVFSQRADEGHPERDGRRKVRDEFAEIEVKIKRTSSEGGAREGDARAQEAPADVARCRRKSTVVRNYLELAAVDPWNKKTKVKKTSRLLRRFLDNDHFGLEKVKERIVEYLAVQQRANKLTGRSCACRPAGVARPHSAKRSPKATGRDFGAFARRRAR